MHEPKWEHKDTWKSHGKNFLVEVVRWQSPEYDIDYSEVISYKNHWNVYAYIYPKHPLFDKLDKTHTQWFRQPIDNLHFHRGCSYMQWYIDQTGEYTAVQLGAGNGHIATKDEAWWMFRDAKLLYNQLLQLQKESDEQAKPNTEDLPSQPE